MVKKKYPIIGISGNLLIDEGGMFPGYERAYVNNDYIQSVVMCKAIPYIVPIVYDDEIIKEQVSNIDSFDMKLLKHALDMKKPVLGICRGEQIINVTEGGSLYQDLSLIEGAYIKHNQQHLSNVPTHTVQIKEGTKLYEILGEKEVLVNSFHHLVVNKVAPGYIVSATSKDGLIEAIEKEGSEFVIGIQWHPEMMTRDYDNMKKIFMAIVKEASK